MTTASTRRLGLSDLIALSWLAVRARYTLSKPARVLFLLGAMFDPFVYAGVIYFVVERVFGLSGFDRFQFLLIGIISFRWTLSCLLDAVNLAEMKQRMAEAGRSPLIAGLVVLAPPSAVTLLSLVAALVFSLIVAAPEQSFRALGWLVLVILVQGVWNLALVLVVDRLRARFRIASEAPLVVLAGASRERTTPLPIRH